MNMVLIGFLKWFLSNMYILDLGMYLYARNHLRSMTTLGLHTSVVY